MIKRITVFRATWAAIRFGLFWLWIIPNMLVALLSCGGKFGVKHFKFVMRTEMFLCGVRVKVHGKLSDKRPLLVASNHISVFEFATFPMAFEGSFFGKAEIAKYPVVGFMAKRFGVIFVDRRVSQVKEAAASVQKQMDRAMWPMVLFPEGTTTNGAYVKQFKSSLFNFIEPQLRGEHTSKDAAVQPVVMCYRHKDGRPISDADMAEHFAYFNNKDQECGPHCSVERSAFGQMFHVMALGGFIVEIFILPPLSLGEIHDRKQLADALHQTISDHYMKYKKIPLQK